MFERARSECADVRMPILRCSLFSRCKDNIFSGFAEWNSHLSEKVRILPDTARRSINKLN